MEVEVVQDVGWSGNKKPRRIFGSANLHIGRRPEITCLTSIKLEPSYAMCIYSNIVRRGAG